jgi:hypothetical protein
MRTDMLNMKRQLWLAGNEESSEQIFRTGCLSSVHQLSNYHLITKALMPLNWLQAFELHYPFFTFPSTRFQCKLYEFIILYVSFTVVHQFLWLGFTK